MKNSQHRNRTSRKPVLSSIGLAVVATLIAGGVHAADTTYNFDGTVANAIGHDTRELRLINLGAVRATLENGVGNIEASGAQTANSTFLTGNTMGASAIGNLVDDPLKTSIDLSLISDSANGNKGLATLLHSTNTGVISSLVDSNSLTIALTGFASGSAANKDNTISARTVVNEGASSIAGTVPNDYSSDTAGSTSISSFSGFPATSAAAGSIVVTTAQQASTATSTATATNNLVSLALTADTLAAIESGAALTGNRVSASVKGNSSASTVDIQSGGAPSFTGSAVVSNTQLGQSASAVADNSNATIRATVSGTNGGAAGQLGGSLAVSGNSISSAATGNEALGSGLAPVGNRILLGDGLAFAGTGGTNSAATLKGYADGTAVSADLLIANTQSNQGALNGPTVVSSTTSNGVVRANVDSLVNGNVNLADNTISAGATGNAASSALASGTGAASFNGSVALANQQDNSNVGISASNIGSTGSTIVATVGDMQDSSVAVAGNRSSASARGNEVGQSLALDATTLTLGSTVDLKSVDNNISGNLLQADGAATVSNRQVNTGAPVTSLNSDSSIGQRALTVSGATLTVGGTRQDVNLNFIDANTQDAVALANNASNQLTLTGNAVGGSAGILSLQRVDPDSLVSATLSGARAFLEAGSLAAGFNGVNGSTLALTNNVQEAIGYGNLGNNALVVTGTTLATPATNDPASTVTIDPIIGNKTLGGSVVAAYGVLNDQSVGSNVSAVANRAAGRASADLVVTGNLSNSAALNDGNTLAAEAYGNFGQSRLALSATNLNGTDFSSVANLTSLQSVNAAIRAQASTGAVALTTINGNVGSAEFDNGARIVPATVSSVSASGNRIDAQASGSRVANTLNVNATNIATVSNAATGAYLGDAVIGSGTEQTTNAAFSLQNVQSGLGRVTATLREIQDATLASDVRVAITGDVTRSSVVADGNAARTSATSNNASNALAIDALGGLASSSALQNYQLTSAAVNAMIGRTGTPGTPETFNATYTAGTSGTVSGTSSLDGNGLLTVNGSAATFDLSGLSLSDKNALVGLLESLNFTVNGNTATAAPGATYDLSSLANRVLSNNSLSFNGFTVAGMAATAGTPNLGGVNLGVGGDVIRSTLSVNDNTTYGLARGNAATNLTSVKGNAVTSGSIITVASAGDASGTLATVADHALSNVQQVTGSTGIASNVYGSFFIKAQPGADISRSSLSVSGNTQMAEARANIAGNSLTLESTALTAVSALQSVQSSNAAVNASSDLGLFAPVAVSDSSVLLSNNSNIALAVINDATNRLTATGSQVGTGQGGTGSVGGSNDSLTAENVLANKQTATTPVSSTASTRLNNQEAFAANTGVAIRSTLSILDNTTAAEATANQAINTASVTGTASQAASVALRNIQESGANVTATATSAARIALAPLAQDALNASTVLLDGNSTTALARGNTATNVLNSLAGSNYGTASGGSVVLGDSMTGFAVNANAGILNRQNNTGTVLASSTDATYQVALNSTGAASIGSSLGVIGNQVAAQAYGNSAVNQLTLNALNTGTPTAAVGSYQSNSGSVTAAVNSVAFGTGITGRMDSSTVRVNGNQITASAIGNSSVSSILAR